VTARVSWISLTPVKALAMEQVDEIDLLEDGLLGDRRFYLIDANDRLVNDHNGPLQLIHAQYDAERELLSMRLADGTLISGEVVRGDEVITNFHRLPRPARRVEGPWDDPLSAVAGEPVRLVAPVYGAADRGRSGAASLLGEASLQSIAGELGVDSVDSRRFRMNFGIEGLEAYAEETWIGCGVQLGDAIVIPQGNVGRCAITTQNPDTGERDLDTLKALARYRAEVPTTEPLPFGVHAAVAAPGRVRVGDPVSLL
jgi:uncharacterized protein YcbX